MKAGQREHDKWLIKLSGAIKPDAAPAADRQNDQQRDLRLRLRLKARHLFRALFSGSVPSVCPFSEPPAIAAIWAWAAGRSPRPRGVAVRPANDVRPSMLWSITPSFARCQIGHHGWRTFVRVTSKDAASPSAMGKSCTHDGHAIFCDDLFVFHGQFCSYRQRSGARSMDDRSGLQLVDHILGPQLLARPRPGLAARP